MMSIWEKILQTYKGHMGLVKHYLFKKFHELFFLLLIIESENLEIKTLCEGVTL